MRYPAFIGGSYQSQSPLAADQRTVNFYVERLEVPGVKSEAALYPTPGVSAFLAAGTGPIRALGEGPGGSRAFAVAGSSLVELASDGTVTTRGTVLADALPAQIVHNGPNGGQLLVASGDKAYCYTLATNTLTEVLSLGARQIGMVDGFFLALDETTATLRISSLFNGTSWDPTQVAQRSLAPDPWRAMRVFFREIWLFGDRTSEVWYNTGAAPFPFAPRPGSLIPVGIAAPWSVAQVGDALAWLSRSEEGHGIVVMASGYTAQRISTHAVEFALRRYPTITDAEGFGYEQDGHLFYVLSFPTAEATWVYDRSTGFWSERGKWVAAKGRFTTWDPRVHLLAFGRHLVGSRTSGDVGVLDPTVSTELDGTAIRRIRRAPGLNREHEWMVYPKLEIYVEPGLGDPQSQPTVTLRWSDDGGKTFSGGLQAIADAGAMGRFRQRVVWRRLGRSRDRVFEVEMSDPIPWRIVDAYLEVVRGRPAAR